VWTCPVRLWSGHGAVVEGQLIDRGIMQVMLAHGSRGVRVGDGDRHRCRQKTRIRSALTTRINDRSVVEVGGRAINCVPWGRSCITRERTAAPCFSGDCSSAPSDSVFEVAK
jgi:hypothetical protein